MVRRNHPSPQIIALRAHFKRLLEDPVIAAKLPQSIRDDVVLALGTNPSAWLADQDRAVWNAVKIAWSTL
jgi:hypothetical protein